MNTIDPFRRDIVTLAVVANQASIVRHILHAPTNAWLCVEDDEQIGEWGHVEGPRLHDDGVNHRDITDPLLPSSSHHTNTSDTKRAGHIQVADITVPSLPSSSIASSVRSGAESSSDDNSDGDIPPSTSSPPRPQPSQLSAATLAGMYETLGESGVPLRPIITQPSIVAIVTTEAAIHVLPYLIWSYGIDITSMPMFPRVHTTPELLEHCAPWKIGSILETPDPSGRYTFVCATLY
jgi:hypothetical protein